MTSELERPARTERGNRTRAKLLSAAEEVFAELGYHDASIVKLTEAAGVAQGTFYLYFGGKQQIFEELVADLNQRVRQAMSEASGKGESRAAAESLGFAAFFRFTAEHPALYRIIRQAEFVSPDALHLHYGRIVDGYADGLRAAMAAGEIEQGDADTIAWAMMGVGEIIGMRWVLWDENREVPPEVFDAVMALVRRAIGVKE